MLLGKDLENSAVIMTSLSDFKKMTAHYSNWKIKNKIILVSFNPKRYDWCNCNILF